MIKKQSGITLVSLVIVIVLMLIISSTVVNVSLDRFEINNFNKMKNDIELLKDKVSNYYLKYNALPIIRNEDNEPIEYTYSSLNFESGKYYILDLSVMGGISLNYGKAGFENPNITNDVYIINELTHTIYYVKGMELQGNFYYTISNNQETITDIIPPTKPEIKVISGTRNYDETYMTEVTLEFIPGKNKVNSVNKTEFSIDGGNTWTDIEALDDSMYKITEDGTYNISARSYDEKGNISQECTTEIKIAIIKIGDKVAYNEGTGKTTTIDSNFIMDDLEWRIIDIEEDGKIELISTNPTTSTLTISGEDGWLNGKTYLNTLCNELYGSGEGALEARSLNVEDLNKLINTGYDPTTYSGYGQRWQYRYSGTQIQYRNSTDDGITWGPSSTDNGWTNVTSEYRTFKEPGKSIIDSEEDKEADLISTYYTYKISNVITNTVDNNTILLSDLLTKGESSFNNIDQWLASSYFSPVTTYGGIFRMHIIYQGEIKPSNVFYSHGGTQSPECRVRPIVVLKSNIKLTKVNEVWQITE